ncbi:hypothetical protein EDD16DRAFT_1528723 [Pisolithus croceorrhizus]|nr:hypothetical protein EDD16DRAFT_1528723 [Pisolithus croceorrhizus]
MPWNAVRKNGLPDISVAASQGKFLKLMALAIGGEESAGSGNARGGLPEDGELITLEVSEVNVKIARENLARAGIRNARVLVVVRLLMSFARGCSKCGAVRTLLKMLKKDKEVEATTIAIANVKGNDGFLYAIKL